MRQIEQKDRLTETDVRQPSLKDLARQVLDRQPVTVEAGRKRAITAARESAHIDDFLEALLLGRLHLCGNCSCFTFGSDPGGPGVCSKFGDGLAPFLPFWCAGFEVSRSPAAPDFLPDRDGALARAREYRK